MSERLTVAPFRISEPLRSRLVDRAGEFYVTAFEADETRWADLMLNGTVTEEPLGFLRGSDMVAQR